MNRMLYRVPRFVRLLLVLALYGLILAGHLLIVNYYDSRWSDKVSTTSVVIANRTIPPHTVITAADLAVVKMQYDYLLKDAITDPQAIIGKEATAQMEEREQFTPSKLNVVVKQVGQVIVEIPSECVASFPPSLRRMDKIAIWPYQEPQANANAAALSELTGNGSQPMNAPQDPYLLSKEPVMKDIVVAYYKDATANDVTDPGDASVPRTKATAVGSRLEVAMSPEDVNLLRELIMKKYKLIISYQ